MPLRLVQICLAHSPSHSLHVSLAQVSWLVMGTLESDRPVSVFSALSPSEFDVETQWGQHTPVLTYYCLESQVSGDDEVQQETQSFRSGRNLP